MKKIEVYWTRRRLQTIGTKVNIKPDLRKIVEKLVPNNDYKYFGVSHIMHEHKWDLMAGGMAIIDEIAAITMNSKKIYEIEAYLDRSTHAPAYSAWDMIGVGDTDHILINGRQATRVCVDGFYTRGATERPNVAIEKYSHNCSMKKGNISLHIYTKGDK